MPGGEKSTGGRSECDGRGADGVSVRSEKSALGEGDGFPVADDEVVDEAHVDERERFGDALGDGAVGRAWLCHAAGMLGCNPRCQRHWSPGGDFLA